MSSESQEMISWMLPLPQLEPLILGKNPATATYTVINDSSDWVDIKAVGLESNDDPRLMISGGTCQKGLHLEPNKRCTIDITINPIAVGLIQQLLYVQHSGFNSPLWIEIESIVTTTPASQEKSGSFLVHDSVAMENSRRLAEQAGHKQFAHVNARDRTIANVSDEPGMDQTSTMKQHPYFAQNQRFDGIENKITPDPSSNPAAKEKYQEAKEEQDLAKQLRLNNTPENTNTPRFKPIVTPRPY